jgi:hypothetical protein
MAGQNIGLGETQPGKTGQTAYDLKEAHVRRKGLFLMTSHDLSKRLY